MNNLKIGENIRFYRKQKKLTQKELALKIGKTESSIRKYEKGLVEIPLSTIEDIAYSLNVPVEKIYTFSENSSAENEFNIIDTIIDACDFIEEANYEFDENNNLYGIEIIEINGEKYSITVNRLKNIENSIKVFFKTYIENHSV